MFKRGRHTLLPCTTIFLVQFCFVKFTKFLVSSTLVHKDKAIGCFSDFNCKQMQQHQLHQFLTASQGDQLQRGFASYCLLQNKTTTMTNQLYLPNTEHVDCCIHGFHHLVYIQLINLCMRLVFHCWQHKLSFFCCYDPLWSSRCRNHQIVKLLAPTFDSAPKSVVFHWMWLRGVKFPVFSI